jgi:hypothetical protein
LFLVIAPFFFFVPDPPIDRFPRSPIMARHERNFFVVVFLSALGSFLVPMARS